MITLRRKAGLLLATSPMTPVKSGDVTLPSKENEQREVWAISSLFSLFLLRFVKGTNLIRGKYPWKWLKNYHYKNQCYVNYSAKRSTYEDSKKSGKKFEFS